VIKIPISGGPHSGKTTLFRELQRHYPEAHFVPEPAERVIAHQLELQEKDLKHQAILPLEDYKGFSPLVREEAIRLEREIPTHARLVFQDRSLVDNYAYDALNGLQSPKLLGEHIRMAGYTLAFFCAQVGNYTPTAIRRESPEQARNIHIALQSAYEESEIEVVHLPPISLRERLQIVSRKVLELS
jgi:predicted ATPase